MSIFLLFRDQLVTFGQNKTHVNSFKKFRDGVVAKEKMKEEEVEDHAFELCEIARPFDYLRRIRPYIYKGKIMEIIFYNLIYHLTINSFCYMKICSIIYIYIYQLLMKYKIYKKKIYKKLSAISLSYKN